MSDSLVRWVDALSDGTVREEIDVDDDGTLERVVAWPAFAPAPTIGWFDGALDDGMLSLARSVAGQPVEDAPGAPRPQAGGWVAFTAAAAAPLWGEGGGSTTASLRSLLAAAVEAAADVVTGVRFEARWTVVGSERAPLLSLTNVGSTPVWCTIEAPEGVTATFLDQDARALGFLGSAVTLDGGASGGGLLRGWAGGGELALAVRLARPDDTDLNGRVVVEITAG